MLMKNNLYLKIVCGCVFLFLVSCSAVKEGIAAYSAPKGFSRFEGNIWIENDNNKKFAREIQPILPGLEDSIEAKQFHQFKSAPVIYLCSTNESFCKYSGSKYPGPRAKVTPNGLFVSPRLQGSRDWQKIIYHELSHVLMFQHLGKYRYFTTPLWFHEGLATYASNGGGTGDVTDSLAIAEILKGNSFYPHDNFIRSYFAKNELAPWLAYRQYMLFVEFLKNGREPEFEKMLNSVFAKKSFSRSVKSAYNKDVSELWAEFLKNLSEASNER